MTIEAMGAKAGTGGIEQIEEVNSDPFGMRSCALERLDKKIVGLREQGRFPELVQRLAKGAIREACNYCTVELACNSTATLGTDQRISIVSSQTGAYLKGCRVVPDVDKWLFDRRLAEVQTQMARRVLLGTPLASALHRVGDAPLVIVEPQQLVIARSFPNSLGEQLAGEAMAMVPA
jgi:hypothetical protein